MEQKDVIKTDRAAITANINRILTDVDDKTLRELERMVIGWLMLKRKIRERQAGAAEGC